MNMVSARLHGFLGTLAGICEALKAGNTPWTCWRTRRAGLFRLPVLYGHLRIGDRPTIVDVGAAGGRSGLDALSVFPQATIHSFEPNPVGFAELREAASHYPGWKVHNAALGRSEGKGGLVIPEVRPEASSFYPPAEKLFEGWPDLRSSSLREITVAVRTMSGFFREQGLRTIEILKLDVQGAELEVLEGGEDHLAFVQYVIVEVSFVQLYQGACTFADTHRFLEARGFSLRRLVREYHDPRGRLLQADALYAGPGV